MGNSLWPRFLTSCAESTVRPSLEDRVHLGPRPVRVGRDLVHLGGRLVPAYAKGRRFAGATSFRAVWCSSPIGRRSSPICHALLRPADALLRVAGMVSESSARSGGTRKCPSL